MSNKNKITVKLTRSLIGQRDSFRKVVIGLGLRKVNSTSVLEDTPAIRGMVNKVSHLVKLVNN